MVLYLTRTRERANVHVSNNLREGDSPAVAKNNIYVERRPSGNYAVTRPGAERASAIRPTQAAAIERAREIAPSTRPDVERVRHTSVGKPDQWRKA